MKVGTLLRQGDVLLERVKAVPAGAKKLARENGHIVLAHGEKTGHSHSIKNRMAEFFQVEDGERFVSVVEPSQLTHQEHNAIRLEPGVYRVSQQSEYTPEAIRNVQD